MPVPGLVDSCVASLAASALAAATPSSPPANERVGTITTSTGPTNESTEEPDVCWICLDGSSGKAGKESMMRPCLCPRRVHAKCLARWQLRQAGRSEEKHCRWDGNGWRRDIISLILSCFYARFLIRAD